MEKEKRQSQLKTVQAATAAALNLKFINSRRGKQQTNQQDEKLLSKDLEEVKETAELEEEAQN